MTEDQEVVVVAEVTKLRDDLTLLAQWVSKLQAAQVELHERLKELEKPSVKKTRKRKE